MNANRESVVIEEPRIARLFFADTRFSLALATVTAISWLGLVGSGMAQVRRPQMDWQRRSVARVLEAGP